MNLAVLSSENQKLVHILQVWGSKALANLKMRLKGLKLMTLLSDSFNKTASPVLEPSKTVPKPVLIATRH